METLQAQFPQIKRGVVITAVDLIRGIGRYAGLRCIYVEGATGLADTNYAWSAGCFIFSSYDLKSLNLILKSYNFEPGTIISGEIVEV